MNLSGRVNNAIANRVLAYQTGAIVNSYYDPNGGTAAFVDVVVQDEDGARPRSFAKVPVMKIGGFSVSLPPVGAVAIVGFLDNNESKPFLIGYLDSDVTSKLVSDDKRPRKPPTILTR